MSLSKVVADTDQQTGRYIRPADVDAQTWARLKNGTSWVLVQKYGPTPEAWKAAQGRTS